jgi:hypothetical protein
VFQDVFELENSDSLLCLSLLDGRKLQHKPQSEERKKGNKTEFDGGTNTTQGREDIQGGIVIVSKRLSQEVDIETN